MGTKKAYDMEAYHRACKALVDENLPTSEIVQRLNQQGFTKRDGRPLDIGTVSGLISRKHWRNLGRGYGGKLKPAKAKAKAKVPKSDAGELVTLILAADLPKRKKIKLLGDLL